MARARQQIVVAFSVEGSGGQPFGGGDDRLNAHLCVPIGFSPWLRRRAVGASYETSFDQHTTQTEAN